MPKQTFFNLPEEKRQAIVDLAIDEFAGHSYQQASISRIVARAGIAKGSFYQYFEDKKDLYLYLIDLALNEKAAFIQSMPPPDPAMGTFAYLRWLFASGVQFEFSNPQLTRVVYHAFYDEPPFLEEVMRQARASATQFSRQLIAQGMDRGDLRADLDVDTAVFLLDVVILELGNHIMQRLQISSEELGTQGIKVFEPMAVSAVYDSVLDVLERGMGKCGQAGWPVQEAVNHDDD